MPSGALGPYMLVPQDEWVALNEKVERLERVLDTSHTTGQSGRDLAEEFLRHFSPAQHPPGWGHVAFCIEQALESRR